MSGKIRTGICAAVGMLILILDSKTALASGIDGIQVCLFQVIPALLPFFVLSILLNSAFSGADLALLRPVGRLCRMPRGSEGLFLMGLMGGYPSGAQGVDQCYQVGQLNRQDASRLLGFCSNAGPAFLFGIASVVFPYRWLPWALWLVHITSALITGIILPGGSEQNVRLKSSKPATLSQALEGALTIMARVCGWIILFHIAQGFIERWFLWLLSPEDRVLIIGIMELANGCLALPMIADVGLRAVLCSAFLALGGLCVLMQTLSVTGPLGLGMYISGKAIQCAISIFFTTITASIFLPESSIISFCPLILTVCSLFVTVFAVVLRKYAKNTSISRLVRV